MYEWVVLALFVAFLAVALRGGAEIEPEDDDE